MTNNRSTFKPSRELGFMLEKRNNLQDDLDKMHEKIAELRDAHAQRGSSSSPHLNSQILLAEQKQNEISTLEGQIRSMWKKEESAHADAEKLKEEEKAKEMERNKKIEEESKKQSQIEREKENKRQEILADPKNAYEKAQEDTNTTLSKLSILRDKSPLEEDDIIAMKVLHEKLSSIGETLRIIQYEACGESNIDIPGRMTLRAEVETYSLRLSGAMQFITQTQDEFNKKKEVEMRNLSLDKEIEAAQKKAAEEKNTGTLPKPKK